MTKKPNEPRDPTDTSHPLYDPTEDPTDPFYGDKREPEQKPDAPDADAYKVGPGFPPNEHKWKKGGPSPYPKGRVHDPSWFFFCSARFHSRWI